MNQEAERVWIELQNTPSYFERYTLSVEIEGEEPTTTIQNCCLSCGAINVDEDHECNGRRAA